MSEKNEKTTQSETGLSAGAKPREIEYVPATHSGRRRKIARLERRLGELRRRRDEAGRAWEIALASDGTSGYRAAMSRISAQAAEEIGRIEDVLWALQEA